MRPLDDPNPFAPHWFVLGEHRVIECGQCFALVRDEMLPTHRQWHDAQEDRWREQWTGEVR